MSEQTTDDPFEDCELGPEAILGTRTYEDVLFTDETETPVNVLTGETPEHSQATVDEARAFASSIDTKTPQIALSASVETQIETASKPYTAAAFFHFKATGSLQRHRAYHAAYKSDGFMVSFEADYATGDLTITVEEVSESERDDG
jgi:microcystin-dependent protein